MALRDVRLLQLLKVHIDGVPLDLATSLLPGRAWLEFKAEPQPDGRTRFTQTALFGPHGLLGLTYWYAMYPAHRVIFGNMIRRVARLGATLTDVSVGRLPNADPASDMLPLAAMSFGSATISSG